MNGEKLITIRTPEPHDRTALRAIIEEVGVFSKEEIDVAVELIDIYLDNEEQKDYHFFTAVDGSNNILGYSCVGPTPLTVGTFDLYWIVVKPVFQHLGIGKRLLKHTEEWVRLRGGRLIIVETSSTAKYENARKFYIGENYRELVRIKEYYKTDDDLIIYGKYLSQPRSNVT